MTRPPYDYVMTAGRGPHDPVAQQFRWYDSPAPLEKLNTFWLLASTYQVDLDRRNWLTLRCNNTVVAAGPADWWFPGPVLEAVPCPTT